MENSSCEYLLLSVHMNFFCAVLPAIYLRNDIPVTSGGGWGGGVGTDSRQNMCRVL